MHPLQHRLREQTCHAGGLAVLFEINLRMLCEKHEETRRFAYKALDDVLREVLSRFEISLSDEEVTLLRNSVKARDFLVHARFDKLNWLLEREFSLHGTPTVRQVGGELTLEALEKAAKGEAGDHVRGQKQKDAFTLGWYYELGAKGGLLAAARVFDQAVTVLHRLFVEGRR